MITKDTTFFELRDMLADRGARLRLRGDKTGFVATIVCPLARGPLLGCAPTKTEAIAVAIRLCDAAIAQWSEGQESRLGGLRWN